MKKHNRERRNAKPGTYPEGCTVGLDVSDEYTYAAVVNREGELFWLRTRSGRVSRS